MIMSEKKLTVEQMEESLTMAKTYERFIELEETVKLRNNCDHSMNFRMPTGLNNAIEDTLTTLKKRIGIKLSKNEFIVLMLLTSMNLKQNAKEEIYGVRGANSFIAYIEENEEELIERVKARIFEEQYNAVMKLEGKRIKVKEQAQKRIAKRYEPID